LQGVGLASAGIAALGGEVSVGCAVAVGTGEEVLAGLRVLVAVGSKPKDSDGSITAVAAGCIRDVDAPQAVEPIEISRAVRMVPRITFEARRNRRTIVSSSRAQEENSPLSGLLCPVYSRPSSA